MRCVTLISVACLLAGAALAGPIKGLVDVGTGTEVSDADTRYYKTGTTNASGAFTSLIVENGPSGNFDVVNYAALINAGFTGSVTIAEVLVAGDDAAGQSITNLGDVGIANTGNLTLDGRSLRFLDGVGSFNYSIDAFANVRNVAGTSTVDLVQGRLYSSGPGGTGSPWVSEGTASTGLDIVNYQTMVAYVGSRGYLTGTSISNTFGQLSGDLTQFALGGSSNQVLFADGAGGGSWSNLASSPAISDFFYIKGDADLQVVNTSYEKLAFWNTEIIDNGGNFTNSQYTAPSSGLYVMWYSLQYNFANLTAPVSPDVTVQLRVNTFVYDVSHLFFAANSAVDQVASVAAKPMMMWLTAGQVVRIYVKAPSNGGQSAYLRNNSTGGFCNWGGFRVSL
jgi:hypothetical protein